MHLHTVHLDIHAHLIASVSVDVPRNKSASDIE